MSRQRKFYVLPRKPSGIYYYIVRDPISRKTLVYKSTGTTDKKQAETLAMEWWTEGIPEKSNKTGFDRKTLFCDYLYQFWDFSTSNYFRELETMGKEPHQEHPLEMQKAVERYYRPYFQTQLLCQIDEETLQKFIVYLKLDKKLAASTVNSVRNAAFVALRYAKRKKHIRHFDFDSVLRAGGKSKMRGVLEKEEIDQLFNLEWPSIKSKIVTKIGYSTGMRISEVRALRLCDIHPQKITVIHNWAKKSKLKCPKNGEIKEIPIISALYEEIMAYIHQMKIDKLDSLLFPGKNLQIPYNDRQIGKNFNKMLEKIGISDEIRKERNIVFHSFRHLMAKNLVEKGVSKDIGMRILGIKTERIFAHYSNHTDKSTFEQMIKAIEMVSQDDVPKEVIPFRKIA